MTKKKCNAVLGLVTALILAAHNTANAVMMLLGRVGQYPRGPAFALMGGVFLHGVISVAFLLFRRDGARLRYEKLNLATLVQRITAFALIPAISLHIHLRVGQQGEGLMAVLITHFFIMLFSFIHISLSVPNALVTLGWLDNSRQHAAARRICWAVCGVLFALGLAASLSEVVGL